MNINRERYYPNVETVPFGSGSAALARIAQLVERYAGLDRSGKVRAYNEARTVNEFILPLLASLGWDVHNLSIEGEVVPEESHAGGRADWTLSIREIPRLMVEAKALSVDLKPEHARQAIKYAYNRGVTWAVLTNFREVKVYNAEWALKDPELTRFFTIRAEEFGADFDKLWLLSRTSLEDGSLNEAARKWAHLRERAPITRLPIREQLFRDLIFFRGELRQAFRPFNEQISVPEVDAAVQRLLDRLIFMRAAEDRGIEAAHLRSLLRSLEAIKKRDTVWPELKKLFRQFDERYDSQLFADQLLDHLSEPFWHPLWQTIEGLYETAGGLTQYEFARIDADVLGGVYEQYLGHVARTPSATEAPPIRGAKLPDTDRPFRKAHGVYYTPRWMVRYIVKGSLGKAIAERTPEEVRRIRVLDPACGSGAFLVEAFRVLCEYWDSRQRPQTSNELLAIRRSVLQENIFGIDLDPQAVEITQLNLLLVALTTREQLPNLSRNIKVGNALLDPKTRPLPSGTNNGGWMAPFDAAANFPFEAPGFDVVVMNPPYYDLQAHPYQQDVLRKVYPEIASGHDDVLYYFLARAVELLGHRGHVGCVVARYWLDSLYAEKLRGHLLDASTVREVLDFRSFQPFGSDVGVNAAIVFLDAKSGESGPTRMTRPASDGAGPLDIEQIEALAEGTPEASPLFQTSDVALTSSPWRVLRSAQRSRLETVPLGQICRMTQGIKTGLNDVFVVSSSEAKKRGMEHELLRPVLEGADIGAYCLQDRGRFLLYLDQRVKDISEYPAALAYLSEFRDQLSARAEADTGQYPWWRLQRPRHGLVLDGPVRLITPHLSTRPRFSLVSEHPLGGAVGLSDTLMLASIDDRMPSHALLAVLNSTYMDELTRERTKAKRGGWREFFATSLNSIPIPLFGPEIVRALDEFGQALQVVVPERGYGERRFDDLLNSEPPRSTAISEIDRLIEGGLSAGTDRG